MIRFRRLLPASVLGLCLSPVLALAANYTLTVEPSYPLAQAREVYQPLLAYLSRTTGHTFTLRLAPSYNAHWRDLRTGVRTDFAFEDPHFVDYRITRQRFIPLVRTIESTRYTLLANDAEFAEGGPNTLIGYRIASMPLPSLGYLVLNEWYRNPIAQPEILSVASDWANAPQIVFDGAAEGAIVPVAIADQYANMITVAQSREMPGRALSASPGVPADVRNKVVQALVALHRTNEGAAVMTELATTQFVPAAATEYAGSERLLRHVFGYSAMTPRPGQQGGAVNAVPTQAPPGGGN